ncbi:MAG: OmpA family protein [Bacteroidales bacterium]|nr:OmpA family protein [Bacteroidales bacterium]
MFSLESFPQRGDCEEIKNKQALDYYEQAIKKPNYKYKEIEQLLQKAIAIQSNFPDAYFSLAEMYYLQAVKSPYDTNSISKIDNYYSKAENYFLKVIELCPAFNYYASYFYLGQFYFKIKDYELSKLYLNEFIEHSQESADFFQESKSMLKNIDDYLFLIQNPVPFNPIPLNDVCTSDDEYLPLISPDEEYLFFSRRFIKFPNTSYEKYIEELNLSKNLSPDSLNYFFSVGSPLGEPFNDGRNQGGATITIDNHHLFITICEFERSEYSSYKNCDIFTSDLDKEKWSPLKRLGSEINSKSTFEGQPSITADGKVLFFSSAREGGYGGLDIYKSVKDNDGNWTKAENLGPVINTNGDDKTPFIHSDSQTLYFSTNGRFGLGGYDVFYSQYRGNGQWSEPRNIGYPINTQNDELGLIVSTNGKRILLSSKLLKKNGDWDIYIADLYKQARPKKVLFVKGKLTDEKGEAVTKAKVGLKNIKTSELTEGMVDENSGDYAVAVQVREGEDFLMIAKKEDAFFNSVYINPDLEKYEPPTTVDLQIQTLEKNKPIRLQNVNFKTGESKLDQVSKVCINQLVIFLKENPEFNIVLQGHTDNQGGYQYNIDLSVSRTKAVKDYISSKGINSKRIKYIGYGETKPLVPNTTNKGRAINRRVEFIVK